MYTINALSQKIPVVIEQKLLKKLDPSILGEQLVLNGWLDEDMVDHQIKDAGKCVFNVTQTDYGIEAIIHTTSSKDPNEKTKWPGFYVAKDRSQLTIPKELERATEYIGRKYVSKLGIIIRKPASYRINDVSVDVDKKLATVQVEKEQLSDATEEEYWQSYITPELTVRYDEGRAVRVLAEAYDYHGNKCFPLPHTIEQAWARNMIISSIYRLFQMMQQHARKQVQIKEYKTSKGVFAMDNLEFRLFYAPRIYNKIFNGEQKVEIPLLYLEKGQ